MLPDCDDTDRPLTLVLAQESIQGETVAAVIQTLLQQILPKSGFRRRYARRRGAKLDSAQKCMRRKFGLIVLMRVLFAVQPETIRYSATLTGGARTRACHNTHPRTMRPLVVSLHVGTPVIPVVQWKLR